MLLKGLKNTSPSSKLPAPKGGKVNDAPIRSGPAKSSKGGKGRVA